MEEIVRSFSFKANNAVWRVAFLVASQVGVWVESESLKGISCLASSLQASVVFDGFLDWLCFVVFLLGDG